MKTTFLNTFTECERPVTTSFKIDLFLFFESCEHTPGRPVKKKKNPNHCLSHTQIEGFPILNNFFVAGFDERKDIFRWQGKSEPGGTLGNLELPLPILHVSSNSERT